MRNPNEIAKVWLGKATAAEDSYDSGRESDAITDLVFSEQYRFLIGDFLEVKHIKV